jgi:hypothetical protein
VDDITGFRDAERPFLSEIGAGARGVGAIMLTISVVDQK